MFNPQRSRANYTLPGAVSVPCVRVLRKWGAATKEGEAEAHRKSEINPWLPPSRTNTAAGRQAGRQFAGSPTLGFSLKCQEEEGRSGGREKTAGGDVSAGFEGRRERLARLQRRPACGKEKKKKKDKSRKHYIRRRTKIINRRGRNNDKQRAKNTADNQPAPDNDSPDSGPLHHSTEKHQVQGDVRRLQTKNETQTKAKTQK